MIPTLIPEYMEAPFEYPKNIIVPKTESLHIGGIGLGDTTEGLRYQAWKLRVSDDRTQLLLSADNYPETAVITDVDIEECSLAFDQNMGVFYTWVSLGVSKFYWFDSTVDAYVTSTLLGFTPYAVMDDSRAESSAINDIVLSYIRDGNLCARIQRDRYEIEYVLGPTFPNGRIFRVGMMENLRVGWLVLPFE